MLKTPCLKFPKIAIKIFWIENDPPPFGTFPKIHRFGKDETYLIYHSSGNVLTSPRPGSVRRSWKVDKQGNLIYTCEELVYCAQCLEANLIVRTVLGKRI